MTANETNMKTSTRTTKQVLIVTTSHAQKGSTGQATGAYVSEVSHPFDVFTAAGWQVAFASIAGGVVPLDGTDIDDGSVRAFLDNNEAMAKLNSSTAIADVDVGAYDAIFLAGGHGTMWDFPNSIALSTAVGRVYDNGGVVGAVCHGPAGLINAKVSGGGWLVDGKAMAAFSNDEERAVGLAAVVPVLLQDALTAHGARVQPAANWQVHVVTDGKLVTGQNPASAKGVAEAMVVAAR